MKAKDVMTQELEREVSFLKDPPWTFACGFVFSLTTTHKAISYDTLLYSSTNVAGAGLDISTGGFTAGHPGSYTATWSLGAGMIHGHRVYIYLRKNGKNIAESLHYSFFNDDSAEVRDQGGRTVVLHLDRGDTLDLYCDNCNTSIYHTTFCVSQFDVE